MSTGTGNETVESKVPVPVLPPDWVVKEARRKPGKFYYFNRKTKESTWNFPGQDKRGKNAKKRSLSQDALSQTSGTSNASTSSTSQPTEPTPKEQAPSPSMDTSGSRNVIIAKRRLTQAESGSNSEKSDDLNTAGKQTRQKTLDRVEAAVSVNKTKSAQGSNKVARTDTSLVKSAKVVGQNPKGNSGNDVRLQGTSHSDGTEKLPTPSSKKKKKQLKHQGCSGSQSCISCYLEAQQELFQKGPRENPSNMSDASSLKTKNNAPKESRKSSDLPVLPVLKRTEKPPPQKSQKLKDFSSPVKGKDFKSKSSLTVGVVLESKQPKPAQKQKLVSLSSSASHTKQAQSSDVLDNPSASQSGSTFQSPPSFHSQVVPNAQGIPPVSSSGKTKVLSTTSKISRHTPGPSIAQFPFTPKSDTSHRHSPVPIKRPYPSTSKISQPSNVRSGSQPIPPAQSPYIFHQKGNQNVAATSHSKTPASAGSSSMDDSLSLCSSPGIDVEMAMEVEYIDSSVLTDLTEVRRTLSAEKMEDDDIPEFLMVTTDLTQDDNIDSSSPSTNKEIYLVIDTNVLVHSYKFVERISDESFPVYDHPILVVPWVVVQELDSLKNGLSRKLCQSTVVHARSAVKFLHESVKSKHPRIICQTPVDERAQKCNDIMKVECNDDRILCCCIDLQNKKPDADVVLLTMDKNLMTKSLIMKIMTHDPKSLQQFLSGPPSSPTSKKTRKKNEHQNMKPPLPSQSPHKPQTAKSPPTDEKMIQPAVQLASDIFSELKLLMKEAFSSVLETLMKRAYDELWETIVFIKPPWTLLDTLACIQKHMIAVFSEFIPRGQQAAVGLLMEGFKPGAHVTSLKHVKILISECGDLLECFLTNDVDKRLQQVHQQLGMLFKITRDVIGQKLQAGKLEALKSVFEEKVVNNNLPMPAGENDGGKHVIQVFQAAWECVDYCKKHLQENLPSSNGEHRAKYVEILAAISKAVINTCNAYSVVLNLNDNDQPSHRRNEIKHLCACIDCIAQVALLQPWESMNPAFLEAFLFVSENREILTNGFNQLQLFLSDYRELWETLTSAEQAQASQ